MIWLISLYASKDQCVTPTTTLFQRLQFSCSRFNSTVSIQLLLFGYHDYRDDGNVGKDNYATTLFQRLQFSCSRFMRKMYEFSHWMDMWRACCNLLDGTFATITKITNIFLSSLNIYYLDYTASSIIFQTIWINHWFYSSGPELLERLLKCQTRIQNRFSIDFSFRSFMNSSEILIS